MEFDARSLLFIPADAEPFIAKGAQRGADVIVLDLEDGVAPPPNSRHGPRCPPAVKQMHAGGATVYVRVNNEPALLADDVAAAVASGADGIVLPKVESPRQLVQLDADLAREEHYAGRPQQAVHLIVLIETPECGIQAAPIARASPRLVAMCLGAEDFSTAMGIDPLSEGMSWPAQSVAIAAAAGVLPPGLPGSVGDFSNPEAHRALALYAKRIGIRGAVCIHLVQVQVQVLNDVFGGTDAEAAAAERLLAAFDAAIAQGKGAVVLGRQDDRRADRQPGAAVPAAPRCARRRQGLGRRRRAAAMSDTTSLPLTVGPVLSVDQLMQDRHVIERQVLVDVADPELGSVTMHNVSLRLSRTPGRIRTPAPAPALGEHQDIVESKPRTR